LQVPDAMRRSAISFCSSFPAIRRFVRETSAIAIAKIRPPAVQGCSNCIVAVHYDSYRQAAWGVRLKLKLAIRAIYCRDAPKYLTFNGSSRGSRLPSREIIVSAGYELNVAGNTQTMAAVPGEELASRLAWAGMYQQDGWLAFRGQSLLRHWMSNGQARISPVALF
jgi:hypothetical protein